MGADRAPAARTAPAEQDEILRRMAQAPRYAFWMLDRGARYLGRDVLDLGAGIGTFTEMLAETGRNVVAVEPDPAFATRLRDRFANQMNVEVREERVDELDTATLGRGVDSVICFNVLEHIADDAGALTQLRTLLAPGGHLLLLVPAHPFLYSPLDDVLGHERRYRKEDLDRLLREASLVVKELRLVNPIGGLGWLISARILRRRQIPLGTLRLYDRLVPLLRRLDAVDWPLGLSVWAVAAAPRNGH
jgi:2-polyprenyl-3-methyl-5-hydroxy-6-metoxy-1,4-benzoquinol methylase